MTADEPKARTTAGAEVEAAGEMQDYVSMTIGGQLFGVPVLKVHGAKPAPRRRCRACSPPDHNSGP